MVERVRAPDDGSKRRPGPAIVTVSPDFKPNLGGEAELAYQLARAFQEQGRLLRVVAPSHETAPEDQALGSALSRAMPLDRFLALDSVRAALRWPVAMASLIQSLRRAVPERRQVTWLLTSYMTWIVLAFWCLGVDYSLFLHGEDVTWACSRGRMKRWLFRRACRRSRWIFFNSAFSRDNLIRRFPEFTPKTQVAGCGVVPGTEWTAGRREEARSLLGWGSGPVLLTVATLRLRKGIDTVIRALPEILSRWPDCRYVVVGRGPDREAILQAAREAGVEGRVEMMGAIEEKVKEKVFAASDLYVMVSYPGAEGEQEGFGITFLEANLHGLPVVGSRCGGIPESVIHEGNGLLVEPRDPAGVAAAVDRLLGEPELRERLVAFGRRRIEEELNWDTIAEKIARRLAEPRSVHGS